MGIGSDLYGVVLLLHIAAVIVGFGGVITHGAYNARAFRATAGTAREILAATQSVTNIAHYAVYAVLPLGIVLVAISDNLFSMGDPWVSASFLVWFALVGAAHGAVRPALRTLAQRAGALDPEASLESDPEAQAASKKLMIGEGGTQLLLIIAVCLMIWKPGG
jgi:uncharacterized membrane protein